MRIGFHFHATAINKDGKIFMPSFFGRWIDSIAINCDFLYCFLHDPINGEEDQQDYCIESTNVKMISIGPHSSVPMRLLSFQNKKKLIKDYLDKIDLFLLRGPSPLLPGFAKLVSDKPIVLLLVADMMAGIDSLPQPKWRKELIRLWSLINTYQQNKIIKKSLTFVNSHKLYKKYELSTRNLFEIKTTTLTEKDFYYRDDTCKNEPINILYTGRITKEKGVINILDAIHSLINKGIKVNYNLVGMVEKKDETLINLLRKANEYGISNYVFYHGYKPTGPELFNFYINSDIYIIASQSSFEGFPRTIWEAMAHSLPVIATNVGSIPDFIEGSAELIEPMDNKLIEEAILKLLNNPELRKKYISSGISLAKRNTLEKQSITMLSIIEQWMKNQ